MIISTALPSCDCGDPGCYVKTAIIDRATEKPIVLQAERTTVFACGKTTVQTVEYPAEKETIRPSPVIDQYHLVKWPL